MKPWCFLIRKMAVPVFLVTSFIFTGTALGQVEVWTARYNGAGDDWDEARAMTFAPDGNIVLTGFVTGSGTGRDIATVKFSSVDGEIIWVREWSSTGNLRDEGVAVTGDTLGNIFVAGWVRKTPADTDWVVIKYLADGTEAWVAVYDSGGPDKPVALVPDEDGGVYVTGYSFNGTNRDYLTIHYLGDGTRGWVARYNGAMNGNDIAAALARAGDGALYVTGYSWNGVPARFDYLTIKYSPGGETLWTRRYDGTATDSLIKSDYAQALVLDDSGNVYVTGRAGESGTWYDATTIKYTAGGQVVWVSRFDWGENALDGAGEIALGPNREVYCAGYTETNIGYFDMLVFKLDPNGQVAWQRIYNYVSDDDSVTAMCVDRFGNVYITGYSYTVEGDLDWTTIKYNSEGGQVWMARHATWDEDDVPYGVGVNQLGDVFVAGFDYLEGSEDYALVKYSAPDVGVMTILQPQDTFRLGALVTPRVVVKNYSALAFTFPVRIEIGNFYFDIQQVPQLAPYDSAVIAFSPWQVRDIGEHQVVAYTMLNGDREPANDTLKGAVVTVAAWEQLASLPAGGRGRGVKDGGALTFAQDSLVFALKGNNTTEFYMFNVRQGVWRERESIPAIGRSGSKKRVKGGAALAADTAGYVFALKGNNTLEFWRYEIASNRWVQLSDFPSGARRVKGGAGMVYLPGLNLIYALRGGNTSDFYCYYVGRDSWAVKRGVPLGERRKQVRDGSAITTDGDSTIYVLKGGTYEFWAYDVARDTWVQKRDIPDSRINPKRRKMKKGGAMAYDPEFHRIYAMKGGKSPEFWFFDLAANAWVETEDTFPRGPDNKLPYGGGAFVYGNGKIYALKGNKTLEFWRYNANFPLNPPAAGPQGQALVPTPVVRLMVAPNPFVNQGVVRYTLSANSRVRIAVYDIAGRERMVLVQGEEAAGEHLVRLEGEGLAAGVYFVRLDLEAGTRGRERVSTKFMVVK